MYGSKVSKNSLTYKSTFALVSAVRILQAFTIPFFPLAGFLGSVLLDIFDYFTIKFFTGATTQAYCSWDKRIDLVQQFMILVAGVMISGNIAGFAAVYIWRLIGTIGYWLTKNEVFFRFFPNLTEVLFLWYLVIPLLIMASSTLKLALLVFMVILKFAHEYFVHYYWDKHYTKPLKRWRKQALGLHF